jgi:hypothetical protein
VYDKHNGDLYAMSVKQNGDLYAAMCDKQNGNLYAVFVSKQNGDLYAVCDIFYALYEVGLRRVATSIRGV